MTRGQAALVPLAFLHRGDDLLERLGDLDALGGADDADSAPVAVAAHA